MKKIEYIKLAIKQKMLFPKTLYYILCKLKFSNHQLATLSFRQITMNRLRKKYGHYLDELNYPVKDRKSRKTIWFCWLQGLENAPKLVKKCYDSLKRNNEDFEIVVITKDNFDKFVEIPKYILYKWRSGIISHTHFSDILRLELLIKQGGIWVDATTFCTSSIPKSIYNKDLFFYTTKQFGDVTINMGSWFIVAKINSPILMATRDLLYKYWKENNVLSEYFLFHLFFKMASEKYYEEYEKVPIYLHEDCHLLSREIFNEYNEERFEEIKRISFVHKLTNKFNMPKDVTGTFYYKIIEEDEL